MILMQRCTEGKGANTVSPQTELGIYQENQTTSESTVSLSLDMWRKAQTTQGSMKCVRDVTIKKKKVNYSLNGCYWMTNAYFVFFLCLSRKCHSHHYFLHCICCFSVRWSVLLQDPVSPHQQTLNYHRAVNPTVLLLSADVASDLNTYWKNKMCTTT